MKAKGTLLLLTCATAIFLFPSSVDSTKKIRRLRSSNCTLKLAMVLCNQNSHFIGNKFGRQLNQTVTFLKSILISTDECVHVLLVSNKKRNFDRVKTKIFRNPETSWDPKFLTRLKLEFVRLRYPKNTTWMQNLFRPCATFRLFLPKVLSRHDAVIYVDTDFIFLRGVQHLWAEMSKFSPTALAGMATRPVKACKGTDSNLCAATWFNSGLILMNLTRMRETGWTEKMMSVGLQYRKQLKFPVQNMLNIYFRKNPTEMHHLSCDWNYRYRECLRKNFCKQSVTGGISALHGNNLSFISKSYEPVFRSIFQTFMSTSLNSTFELRELIGQLKLGVEKQRRRGRRSACTRLSSFENSLLRRLEEKLMRDYTISQSRLHTAAQKIREIKIF